MRDAIRKLRQQVAMLPDGRRKRFPATVREEISRLGQRLRAEGKSWREVGAELGVHVESVRRFCQQKRPGFAAVEVVEEASRPVVVSPRGFRVEGLTVAAVAELLERLR
jgi:hypothetical protein